MTDHGHWDSDPRFPVEDWEAEVANDETRTGYWAWVEYRIDLGDPDPEPGPTYDVWIAEPDEWTWQSCGDTFTCDDDPDGKGARRLAHDYARYLRNTYPCAFVAVRRADRGMPFSVRYRDNQ